MSTDPEIFEGEPDYPSSQAVDGQQDDLEDTDDSA